MKLDYVKVESVLKSEEDFHKILLFLSMNHPYQFPNYILPSDFSKLYGIKENMLTYYVDEIVENGIYPIKFFELKVPKNKYYYFQEGGKLEAIIRAITEDHITEITYLDKLYARPLNFSAVIDNISNEICEVILDKKLKESFHDFLPSYINHLAFKIEAKSGLKQNFIITKNREGVIIPSRYI